MRIGLNLLFLLPSIAGGTETYSRCLIDALLATDKSNQYVLFINKESKNLGIHQHEGVQTIECPIKATNRVSRFLWEQLILPWQVNRLRLDVLHSLGYTSPLVLSCKSVVTIHDLNFLAIPEAFTGFTRWMQRLFVTGSAKRADHIIVVSKFIRSQLIDYLKGSSEKITAIYEAPKIFKQAIDESVEWKNLKKAYSLSKPYIFAFSSLAPHKNLDRLIQAFAKIKGDGLECMLIIAGHQPLKGPSLKDVVSEVGLNDDVVFTGYLSDTAIYSLLSHATLFAFPSLYEGFGLPILEAMAAGTIVACSKRASIPEVAGNAAVYFDPLDVNDIASAIRLLLTNEEKRDALKACAVENLKRFSWQEAANQTLGVYAITCTHVPCD